MNGLQVIMILFPWCFSLIFYAFQKRRLRTEIYKFTHSDVISYLAKDDKRGLNSHWLSTQSLIATDFQIYKWNKICGLYFLARHNPRVLPRKNKLTVLQEM